MKKKLLLGVVLSTLSFNGAMASAEDQFFNFYDNLGTGQSLIDERQDLTNNQLTNESFVNILNDGQKLTVGERSATKDGVNNIRAGVFATANGPLLRNRNAANDADIAGAVVPEGWRDGTTIKGIVDGLGLPAAEQREVAKYVIPEITDENNTTALRLSNLRKLMFLRYYIGFGNAPGTRLDTNTPAIRKTALSRVVSNDVASTLFTSADADEGRAVNRVYDGELFSLEDALTLGFNASIKDFPAEA